ncbi:MAG: DUF4167 domain-containing protein [Magnetovibrionaceae bacterium]
MKHASNGRRGRSRGQGKHRAPGKNTSFESNGPDVKVRGTAQQIVEKYLSLARDATSSGDRIGAEAFYQYAEHYYRVMMEADRASQGNNAQPRQRQDRPTPGEPDPNVAADQAAAASEAAEAAGETDAAVEVPVETSSVEATAETDGEASEAPQERPRRRRSSNTEAAPEAEAAAEGEAEKPRRRGRGRPRKQRDEQSDLPLDESGAAPAPAA